ILFHTDNSRKRAHLTQFLLIMFPGVIAFYVSSAFDHIVNATHSYTVMHDAEMYLVIKPDDILSYVGIFDRLLSLNFFCALVLAFLAIAPIMFRNMIWVVGPYAAYGVVAF